MADENKSMPAVFIPLDNYTVILEFEVVDPTNEMETVGEKLSLTYFGEYCPPQSMRGYNIVTLIENPAHYRISMICMKGYKYHIPPGRPQNFIKALNLCVEGKHPDPDSILKSPALLTERLDFSDYQLLAENSFRDALFEAWKLGRQVTRREQSRPTSEDVQSAAIGLIFDKYKHMLFNS